MTPDDRVELIWQALAILGTREALPALLELVGAHKGALEREDGLRWKEAGDPG